MENGINSKHINFIGVNFPPLLALPSESVTRKTLAEISEEVKISGGEVIPTEQVRDRLVLRDHFFIAGSVRIVFNQQGNINLLRS